MTMEPSSKPLASIYLDGERWRIHRLPFFGVRVFHGPYVEWPILTPQGFKWAKYDWNGDKSSPDPIPDLITSMVREIL